jgi:two-component system response regulator YesN
LEPAANLLKLVVREVEMAGLAELRQAELSKLRRAIASHEREEDRLRKLLHRSLGVVCETSAEFKPEDHSEQLAHGLLDFIFRNYVSPITLKQYAEKAGMNPVYLSAAFSRIVGLPFKAYLTELRLGRAKEELANPSRRVSEVAYGVGYTDPNRFRLAFKAATGLSPKAWRETLRASL